MNSYHQDYGETGYPDVTASASLAEELKSVVDRLEAACGERRPVSWEIAGEVRRIRERAQRLFGDFT